MSFDDARAVADAVLFEGYALYPYRASAPKNQLRWQFGVLAPRAWSQAGGGDPWWLEAQCLIQPGDGPTRVAGKLRFLQLRRAEAQPAEARWDEGEKQEVDFEVVLPFPLAGTTRELAFQIAGAVEGDGPAAHRRWPLAGRLAIAAEPVAAPQPLVQLRVRVENVDDWLGPALSRDEALRASFLGTHLMMAASGGAFVSLLEPPDWAAAAAAACRSVGTYPVLAGAPGRRDLVLSAPVILYDHPAVAPESPRDLYDATEIDEILTLRILTLTDEEKREVRATDPRLAALLDGVERLGPEEMSALHGTIRGLRDSAAQPQATDGATDGPGPARLQVGGAIVEAGSRVRLRPGARRSDAQDMFLAGMTATVQAVMRDVEDRDCLAVSLDDDPASEVMRWHGRYHYFYPDEVEPVAEELGTEATR